MTSDPKKFPLLRLPTLAAEQLIRSMEVVETFIFSLTSTKAKTLLNYSLPKNYAHISCSLHEDKTFDILFCPGRTGGNFLRLIQKQEYHFARAGGYNSYKIHNIQCELFLPRFGAIRIISDRPFKVVAEAFLTHLAECFHTPKISMEFGKVTTPRAALGLLNHSKSLNLPMERISLKTTNTPPEVYRAFLSEGPSISGHLFLSSISTGEFQYSPSEVFKLDRFYVEDGHWVHPQDFMECRSIEINNITANPHMYSANAHRLNEFFKIWQRSSCRLEYLQITTSHSEELNFEEVFMGLNGTNFTRNDEFQSVDIERDDGRKAVITLTRMFLTMKIRN